MRGWIGRQRDPDPARHDLVTALVERGYLPHARWVAEIAGLDARELAEIEHDVATRGD